MRLDPVDTLGGRDIARAASNAAIDLSDIAFVVEAVAILIAAVALHVGSCQLARILTPVGQAAVQVNSPRWAADDFAAACPAGHVYVGERAYGTAGTAVAAISSKIEALVDAAITVIVHTIALLRRRDTDFKGRFTAILRKSVGVLEPIGTFCDTTGAHRA